MGKNKGGSSSSKSKDASSGDSKPTKLKAANSVKVN